MPSLQPTALRKDRRETLDCRFIGRLQVCVSWSGGGICFSTREAGRKRCSSSAGIGGDGVGCCQARQRSLTDTIDTAPQPVEQQGIAAFCGLFGHRLPRPRGADMTRSFLESIHAFIRREGLEPVGVHKGQCKDDVLQQAAPRDGPPSGCSCAPRNDIGTRVGLRLAAAVWYVCAVHDEQQHFIRLRGRRAFNAVKCLSILGCLAMGAVIALAPTRLLGGILREVWRASGTICRVDQCARPPCSTHQHQLRDRSF